MTSGDAGGDVLTPTYVSVGESAWSAESDAPVLALEGLKPWETIRGPALLLDDALATAEEFIADSHDPQQLDLTQDAQARRRAGAQDAQDAQPRLERPVLVLESEPPVEIQAELPLVIPLARVVAAAPAGTVVADTEPVSEAEAPVVPEPLPLDLVEQRYQEARTATAEGRHADARELYRRVLVERASHVGARTNLALLLEASGEQQGALAEYDRALEIDAENVTLLTKRGALLGAMGRYAAAERDLKKVLRADPAHPEALFSLGVVMTKKGLWAEAVPQLRRAVELDPAKGQAYFSLGEALNHVDDLYGAMAAYQRASELMPAYPRALYGLGIVYDRLGRPDDAARMYRRSREVTRR